MSTPETSGSLLLVDADQHRPLLEEQPSASAASEARPNDTAKTPFLWNERAHVDDLSEQRWGVIAPEGAEGDRLLAIARPLLRKREEDQGVPPIVYRVPPRMDALESITWRREVFDTGAQFRDALPRYQLILGDLHQVSVDLQVTQAIDAFVGRLAFDELEDYAAYIDKLLRWEREPAPNDRRRLLLHTVHDGTRSTAVGYRELVKPSLDLLDRAIRYTPDLRRVDLLESGSDDDPYLDELLNAAGHLSPTVLLSLSHGDGAPRRGWRSYELQRRHQGAMSFGSSGSLTGELLRSTPFLPGGLWFMLACFSAGTPSTSKFERWLRLLGQSGAATNPADVLRSLPATDQAPFVASIPKAALANPEGPLGFIGHVDLAWTYSFRRVDSDDRAQSRPARFGELLRAAVEGSRIGVAFRELYSAFTQIDSELVYRQADPNTPPERRGHLWMLRQDLAGYILLGDPAARLPTPKAAVQAPVSPEPQQSSGGDLAGFFGFAVSQDQDQTSASAPKPKLSELERAIAEVLAGADLRRAAGELGLEPEALRTMVERYRDAGRAALRRAGDVD